MPNLLNRVVLAFNARLWQDAGGDIGDNSCFWQLARVTAIDEDWKTVDLVFIGESHVSRGHLISGLKYSNNI